MPLPLAEGAGPKLPFQGIIEDAKREERGAKHVVAVHSLPFQSYACLLPDRCALAAQFLPLPCFALPYSLLRAYYPELRTQVSFLLLE